MPFRGWVGYVAVVDDVVARCCGVVFVVHAAHGCCVGRLVVSALPSALTIWLAFSGGGPGSSIWGGNIKTPITGIVKGWGVGLRNFSNYDPPQPGMRVVCTFPNIASNIPEDVRSGESIHAHIPVMSVLNGLGENHAPFPVLDIAGTPDYYLSLCEMCLEIQYQIWGKHFYCTLWCRCILWVNHVWWLYGWLCMTWEHESVPNFVLHGNLVRSHYRDTYPFVTTFILRNV